MCVFNAHFEPFLWPNTNRLCIFGTAKNICSEIAINEIQWMERAYRIQSCERTIFGRPCDRHRIKASCAGVMEWSERGEGEREREREGGTKRERERESWREWEEREKRAGGERERERKKVRVGESEWCYAILPKTLSAVYPRRLELKHKVKLE